VDLKKASDEKSLLREVKDVQLSKKENFYPYKDSEVGIYSLVIKKAKPLAKYVIREKLKSISLMREKIQSEYSVDILNIQARHTYTREDGKKFTIIPPVLENIGNEETVLGIVDGLHRCFLALESGKDKVSCVVIDKPKKRLPFEPCEWENIDVVSDPPDYEDRRKYNQDVLEKISNRNTNIELDRLEYYSKLVYRDLPGSKGVR